MAKITLKGSTVHTSGQLPALGTKAPEFTLVNKDLADVHLSDFAGKRKLLNVFPSLDTAVCAESVKRFNAEASKLKNTVVLNISADLPFAQSRFCVAEGIKNSVSLSTFRSSFAKDYGLAIVDGPLAGLCSRAVVVLDEENTVLYTEQAPEIVHVPDYTKALAALA